MLAHVSGRLLWCLPTLVGISIVTVVSLAVLADMARKLRGAPNARATLEDAGKAHEGKAPEKVIKIVEGMTERNLADERALKLHPIWGHRGQVIINHLVKSGWDKQ